MFVKKSNLPENTKIVLLGEKYCDELKNPLENLGVNVLPVPDNPFVDPRLSSHADLSVFHAGDNHIFLAEYLKKSELYDNLRRLGFKVTVPEVKWGACYPDDCSFNLFFNGDYVICNKDTANESILRHLGSSPKLVFCQQGYCKCLICAVDDNAIITSDHGIAERARDNGLEVLEIEPGFIILDGFNYGFIGGASVKLSKDVIAFTGHFDDHPEKDLIIEFLRRRGVEAVFLTERRLFDVGSILPITEKQR